MISVSTAIIESLRTAPLLGNDAVGAPVFYRKNFDVVDKKTILNLNQKLGHLYEQALYSLICTSDKLECVAHNLQIFDENKKTLGELDYVLFEQQSQSYIHLELAVKFYLAKEINGKWVYPGPDARDNWHRKLERMQNHQFILPQSIEAKKLLKNSFDIDHIETQQLIYGCLFFPMNSNKKHYPEGVSRDCRFGKWLFVRQWKDYFDDVESVYAIPKALWPVEIRNNNLHLYDKISTNDLIQKGRERCTMFFINTSTEPVFIVPDNWAINL